MTAWFVDVILENSPTRPKSRALDWTLSLSVHGILVAAMFVVPLYRNDGIELHSLNYTQVVAASAEVEPDAYVKVAPKSVAAVEDKFVAPRSISNQVPASRQYLGEADPGPGTPSDIVGRKVKAPRLISMVEPVYPSLLRRARVQGDVVIDAVIDTQGNVAEAHAVSGNDLLVPAAMDAVRRWKYEPTVLDGTVFPVFLRVTITFRLGVKS